MRFYFTQSLPIRPKKFFDTPTDNRLKEVSTQSETLAYASVVWRQLGSKPIHGYLVEIIEVLQNSNNLCYGLNV